MTLKDLVLTHTWPSISTKFIKIYPDAEQSLAGYKAVFKKLLQIESEKIDMFLIIRTITSDDENYVDVSGLHKQPKTKEDHYPQGIEFVPWRNWLGMKIHQESLDKFSEQDIIIHCLYEMTFVGFSEEYIQNALKKFE